jgi:DNA-binding MarR family transcriptional regulator
MTLAQSQLLRRNREYGYGSGSQQALRARNLEALTRDLEDNGPGTQRQLAERTGLSPATVSNLVGILVDNGHAITASTISSGRRAILVTATIDASRSGL